MHRALSLAFLLSISCGGASGRGTPVLAPTTLPVPPGFGQAGLVALDGGAIVAYRVDGDAVIELGRTTLTDLPPEAADDDMYVALEGDWIDRDHLLVHVRPHDPEVLVVSATGVGRLPLPPAAALDAPRPPTPEGAGELEPGDLRLTVADGRAWWSRCAWGYWLDGYHCVAERRVQVWPAIGDAEDGGPPAGRTWPWTFTEVAPAGYRTELRGQDDEELVCQGPDGATTFGEEEGEYVVSRRWLPGATLLVQIGNADVNDQINPSGWELHAGCAGEVIALGVVAVPGPGDLWTDRNDLGPVATIYRGATALGEVAGRVLWRPLAR